MTRPRLASAYLRRRFAEGARLLEVAAEVGCDRHTVVRHCRVHGIELPAPQYGPVRRVPSTAEVLTRLGGGESATAIARTCGVTRPAIVRALDRDGFVLRDGIVTKKETSNA